MYPLQDLMASEPHLCFVLEALENAGFAAHLVGGSVRNALMGLPSSDFDVATNAHPEAVQSVFEKLGMTVYPTGIEHGTLTVVVADQSFEVTTWRRDIATDGRRATIAYADRIEEDARRRDFTMNALYADRLGRVVDPNGFGVQDAQARHIRFVGDVKSRVLEDHLRILRYFRFLATHAKTCDHTGVAARIVDAHAHLTQSLPRERVGAELVKLLGADDPTDVVIAMLKGSHLQMIFGETLFMRHDLLKDRLTRLLAQERMMGLAPCFVRRLAAIVKQNPVHDLKLSKAQARHFDRITEAAAKPAGPAELGYRYGVDDALDALCLRYAYRTGHARAAEIDAVHRGAGQVFPIKGADLAGRYQGRQIGEALRQAETSWIASDFALGRDTLLAAA